MQAAKIVRGTGRNIESDHKLHKRGVLLKKATITGATGFLGNALLKELVKNDIRVYAIYREGSQKISRINGIPNVEIVKADLNRPEQISELNGCDVFYHLAWEGARNDFDGQYKNIPITVNCLKLAHKIGCKRFICTGSQAEYGDTNELITEETPPKPTTAYGACKTAAYYLTADLAKRLNIEYTWARVFSVYGPNDNPNTLIMSLIKDLRSTGKAKLNTNGEHIWNYLHEEDAARALRMLGETQDANAVYNVASRESRPLKEYVEDLRKIVDDSAVIEYGTERSMINLNVSTAKLTDSIGEFENRQVCRNDFI
jgi:nucleoside-diphosphate-sugar epimerase